MDVHIKTPTNKITDFSDQSVNVTLLCVKNLEKMLGYGNGWGRLTLTFKVMLTSGPNLYTKYTFHKTWVFTTNAQPPQ